MPSVSKGSVEARANTAGHLSEPLYAQNSPARGQGSSFHFFFFAFSIFGPENTPKARQLDNPSQ